MRPGPHPFALVVLVAATTVGLGPAARVQAKETAPSVVAGDLGRQLDEAVQRAGGGGLWGTVLVARGGEVLLAKGYGNADYRSRANAPDSLFEIASVSKQFTAAAVLRLEQQKKLRLTDTLDAFFDGIPKDKRAVTVQHLLHHTAGLDPELGVPYDWGGARPQYVREVLGKPLVAEPGSRFSYSNVGYALLAAIVEAASRQSFEDYVRKQVFRPAGLKDIGFVRDRDLVRSPRITVRRGRDGQAQGTAADWHYGWGYRGMGGVVTTALEMLAWDKALRGDEVLGEAARSKLYAPGLEGYACGWKVETTERGTTRVHHSGAVAGYACQYGRWIDEDVVVVLLSNGASDLFAIEREIVRLLFAPARVTVAIDAGPHALNANGAVEPADGRWDVEREDGDVVMRLMAGEHALTTARLPASYARKLAADLEALLAGRSDLDEPAALRAGIYLGPYQGPRRLDLEEDVALEVLPRYVGTTGTEEVLVLVIVDRRRSAWPMMAKMNGPAARALLEALRKAA